MEAATTRADAELLEAIARAWAVIEFKPDGTIVRANANFCGAVGYTEQELIGRHHRMFCDPVFAESQEYADLWDALRRGRNVGGIHLRRRKNGSALWLEASYMPVFDDAGKVCRVVKMAADITAAREHALENDIRIGAMRATSAVAEFTPGGDLIDANLHVWRMLGRSEVAPAGDAPAGLLGWIISAEEMARLMRGDNVTTESCITDGSGTEHWLLAHLSPARNASGEITKIMLFGTDVTTRKKTVEETNDLMKQVLQVSEQIGNIVGTINGIAIQTQTALAQCGHRGGSCRPRRPRVCRGGGRGAHAVQSFRRCGPGDRWPDRDHQGAHRRAGGLTAETGRRALSGGGGVVRVAGTSSPRTVNAPTPRP